MPGGGKTSTMRSRWSENSNAVSTVGVLSWTYGLAIYYGVLRADDAVVCAFEQAVQTAEGAGDDFMLGVAEYSLGIALLNRDAAADRDRGLKLMVQARHIFCECVVHSLSRWSTCAPPGRGPGAATAMLRYP